MLFKTSRDKDENAGKKLILTRDALLLSEVQLFDIR